MAEGKEEKENMNLNKAFVVFPAEESYKEEEIMRVKVRGEVL